MTAAELIRKTDLAEIEAIVEALNSHERVTLAGFIGAEYSETATSLARRTWLLRDDVAPAISTLDCLVLIGDVGEFPLTWWALTKKGRNDLMVMERSA